MPFTHLSLLVAALAIAGIPPFAGFWSKDEILVAVYQQNTFLYVVGIFVAGLTALYIFRIYFGIFWGKDTAYEHRPAESPASMTIPLIVLAILSATAGFIPFSEFISPDRAGFEAHLDIPMAITAVVVALIGIGIAWLLYKKESGLATRLTDRLGVLYTWAHRKFYIDEVYLFVTRNILFKGIAAGAAWADRKIVDGTMNLIGNSTVLFSKKIKGIQSGRVQDYAMAFVSGTVVLALLFIYLWTS